MTGIKGKTIHSILGLQPNMDLATFTPLTMNFVRKNDGDINYKLIVIDEASMINKALYEELKARALDNEVKILFTGDPLQLLPVKEKTISKAFTDPTYKARLNNIVRQGDNNPNTELVRVAANDVLSNTDKLDDYILRNSQQIDPNNLHTSKGFVYLDNTSFRMMDYLLSDKDNLYSGASKYLAYTNTNIMFSAKGIRKNVFGIKDYLSVGEQLMGYRAVTIKKGKISKTKITNSDDYVIVQLEEGIIQEGIKGYIITLENVITHTLTYVNIVDATDKDSFERYKEILFELYFKAKTMKGRAWIAYYNFINNILCLEDISAFIAGVDEKIKTKCVYYNSGITIHKCQGSTYTNSFVNLSNINNSCFSNTDTRRLKYVGVSRAKDVNIIM